MPVFGLECHRWTSALRLQGGKDGSISLEGGRQRRSLENSLLLRCFGAVSFHSSLKRDMLREAKSFAQPCANACAVNMTQDFGPTLGNVDTHLVSTRTLRLQVFLDVLERKRQQQQRTRAYGPLEIYILRLVVCSGFPLVMSPLSSALEFPGSLSVCLASSPASPLTLLRETHRGPAPQAAVELRGFRFGSSHFLPLLSKSSGPLWTLHSALCWLRDPH